VTTEVYQLAWRRCRHTSLPIDAWGRSRIPDSGMYVSLSSKGSTKKPPSFPFNATTAIRFKKAAPIGAITAPIVRLEPPGSIPTAALPCRLVCNLEQDQAPKERSPVYGGHRPGFSTLSQTSALAARGVAGGNHADTLVGQTPVWDFGFNQGFQPAVCPHGQEVIAPLL
jgi:hypothetical protein